MKIELGPGKDPFGKGYFSIDLREDCNPSIVRDFFNQGTGQPSNCAEEIVAIHVLEHTPQHLLVQFLQEVLRVLKPGGVFRVHVPNFQEIAKVIINDPSKLPMVWNLIHGSEAEDYSYMFHRVSFNEDIITKLLLQAGFTRVENKTSQQTDRHTEGWKHTVPMASLIMWAYK
jgi:predicted SAM-dependent methyltransferase